MHDMERFDDYIGREQRTEDMITGAPLQHLAAMLDSSVDEIAPDGEVPPLWHWGFFLEWPRQSQLGPDGHAERGDFLPPIPLPRRMLAGAHLSFHRPLRIGDVVERTSRIESIEPKQGRSGMLYFVTVCHEISGPDGLAIHEEQNIVYRNMGSANPAGEQPRHAELSATEEDRKGTITPDPTLLFRFSAVTGNSHRIHYDRAYAMEIEGYPGLVVHGPLQAVLLLDTLRRHLGSPLKLESFSFRSQRPLFDVASFSCAIENPDGDPVGLATHDQSGNICTSAEAELS